MSTKDQTLKKCKPLLLEWDGRQNMNMVSAPGGTGGCAIMIVNIYLHATITICGIIPLRRL